MPPDFFVVNTMIDPISDIRILFQDDDILAVHKPSGIPTHSPDQKKQGLFEILSEQTGLKLGVHQRLDEETSGVIVFSKSKRGAEKLAKAFELRNIQKTYRALVCGHPAQASGTWQHRLIYENGYARAHENGKLAKARYRVLSLIGPFALLELDLLTGLTHQLRAQCAIEGFPILGDSRYGGGDCFPRLCLHAARLRITSEPNLPTFRDNPPSLLDKPTLDEILRTLFKSVSTSLPPNCADDEAIRLFSPQHSGVPEIIAEKLAHVLFIRHIEPERTSLWQSSSLSAFAKLAAKCFHCSDVCYRVHESPNHSAVCRKFTPIFPQTPAPFLARENGTLFSFDLSGNATGLYLDQRDNRAWIKENARGNVLNLFAYTCAFSVVAAQNPNVTATTSLDSSAAALKRGKINFENNSISIDNHRFMAEDAMKYLRKCKQNGITYDTVICDPPSFGRAGKNIFSLDACLEELLSLCVSQTAPGGVLLFSLNHRKIRCARLRTALKEALRKRNDSPTLAECFVNDETESVLHVGTDLKTIRCIF